LLRAHGATPTAHLKAGATFDALEKLVPEGSPTRKDSPNDTERHD
jgi:hypothetical protein